MTDALRARRSALRDMVLARRAWRDWWRPIQESNLAAESPVPPLVPHRVPWIFSRARRALWAGAQLEPDEHAELLREVADSTEQIPPEVFTYLAQRSRRGRPRRLTTAEHERQCMQACWLLWGYYRRIGRPEPRESAWETAAIIFNVSAGTVEAWKKKSSLRPW